MLVPWREAMHEALYGETGFFVTGEGPAAHFRTSAHASPLFARAMAEVAVRVDAALNHPDEFTIVDIGAGRGELLRTVNSMLDKDLRRRAVLIGVERAARPTDLPADIHWQREPPEGVTGLLIATEWLDNVPLDIAEVDDTGVRRRVLVDPHTGAESLGEPISDEAAAWLDRWWPQIAVRAEIGQPRDAAWAAAVATVSRGLAVAVDYGHVAASRPVAGTLTGYRDGRQVAPVPDGSSDVTAHVAMDAVAAAGGAVAGREPRLLTQRAALHACGITGKRPPLSLASQDPARYVRALAAATQAAELTDPEGLGAHYWLWQPVGIPLPEC